LKNILFLPIDNQHVNFYTLIEDKNMVMIRKNYMEKKEEMVKLHNKGFNYAEIARMFGCTRQNVRKTILRPDKPQKRSFPFVIVDDIRFSLNDKGYYVTRKFNNKHLPLHVYIYEKYNGKIPEGYDIHHVDGDSLNNNIDNLLMIEHGEHRKLHSKTGLSKDKSFQDLIKGVK
jgi:hypothetical protein